ncbi:tetratricopeptide repeat protein [Paenibacillus algorifonticola]|uniref:tetratricopeptide repeat protein n=1 Tax=Paenibacillus algorifonticola TaxID=684063 RepID=UPI003D2CF126
MEDGKFSKDWPHDWIKKIRSRPARHGLSKRLRQVDLAKRVGVDPRTVQQWENGDRLPSVGSLKRMIQAFWEEGLFLEGAPRQEAEELWFAVKRFSEARSATSREFPDFDVAWFETLLNIEESAREATSSAPSALMAAARLPRLPSLFVGRSQPRADLEKQLNAHPLVSIVGPGGIGKTSLAVQVASTLAEKYPHGILMFEFGDINDSLGLNQLLLSMLGLQNQANRTDLQTVQEALSNQKMLLIFDNCEHVIDASATLVESLLATAPELTILATSREPLNISGEFVYRIPPLSFPADEHMLQEYSEQEIMDFDAVRLFLERARITAPQFQSTLPNLRLVGAICKRLEGIPLAIELAVVRMNMLTLEQIEERLTNLLTLLTAGKRTAAPRQQTLKSTIDWSYNLLTGKEQLLLRRLSVFSGGFTLEAAEEICTCELGMHEQGNSIIPEIILDLLSGLVNKSLVYSEIGGDYRFIRYFMLETIKEYAAEKLLEEHDDRNRHLLSERHARYYSECLVRAEPKFRTRQRDACIEEVRQEYANLRSALQWSHSNPQAQSFGLHMVSNLYWFWLHEGRLKEGLLWLDRFLDSEMHEGAYSADIAKALHGRGVIQFILGNSENAMVAAARSVDLARALKECSLLASSLRLLAFLHIKQKRFEEAELLVQQSVDIARTRGELWNLASSLHAYGKLRLEQKNYQAASVHLNESVHVFESVQDQWEVSGPYESLGYSALKLGQLADSIEWFKKCISASQIYRGYWVLSRGLEGLSLALCAKKAFSEAAILLGAAEKGRQSSGGEAMPNFPAEHAEVILDLEHIFSEQELRILWSKGREMTRAQALAYALEI